MRKYRLVAKKGEGTFSEVLKAQNVKDGKYYAIKCMKNRFDSIDQVSATVPTRKDTASWHPDETNFARIERDAQHVSSRPDAYIRCTPALRRSTEIQPEVYARGWIANTKRQRRDRQRGSQVLQSDSTIKHEVQLLQLLPYGCFV